MILIAGFRPVGIDNDSYAYESALNAFFNNEYEIKEPAFILFSELTEVLFNKDVTALFLMYAISAITLKSYCIYRYADLPLMSLMIYIGMYFILHDMTQIRVGVAAAFFLLAIPDLITGSNKRYVIKISLAIFFHYSAFLLLPLIFLKNKKISIYFYFLLPFITLASVILIGDMHPILIKLFSFFPAPLGPKAVNYIINLELYGRFDNINIFSKSTLFVLSIFMLYTIVMLKMEHKEHNHIIFYKIMSLMLTLFYLCSSVPVLASRAFELLGVSMIFSLPALCLKIHQKKIMLSMLTIWVVAYFCVVCLKLLDFSLV
ncbi:EpsG family protein [Erwinia sp. E_sp_B04_9]